MGHYDSSRDWEAEKAREKVIDEINKELEEKSLHELWLIKDIINVVHEIRTIIKLIKK